MNQNRMSVTEKLFFITRTRQLARYMRRAGDIGKKERKAGMNRMARRRGLNGFMISNFDLRRRMDALNKRRH